MARWVGLLRGVNVAGNRLAMPDLRRVVETLGGSDVETYLQSGNVIFRGPKRVGLELEQALLTEVGVHSPVLLRSHAELVAVVEGTPYDAGGKLVSVTFLDHEPDRSAVEGIDATAYGDDDFAVAGREVYLHTPHGYGRSKLGNAFWEKKLGVTATTRNWNTVLALAEMSR